MERFEEILDKCSWPKRLTSSPITIALIEQFTNFNLPKDYKAYLKNYSGFEANIGKEFVELWDLEELPDRNHACGIFENLPDTLAIGGNGSSEFIAIERDENDQYRIVLSPFIDLDKQYHIEIGASFSDFLIRLENEQEWFE